MLTTKFKDLKKRIYKNIELIVKCVNGHTDVFINGEGFRVEDATRREILEYLESTEIEDFTEG